MKNTVKRYPYMTTANRISSDIENLKELRTELGNAPETAKNVATRIKEKRRERAAAIEQENENAGMHYFSDNNPDVWYLEKFENVTAAEVQEWAEEEVRITAIPSQYDCTGQAFTTGLKAYQAGENVFLYHSIGMDI